MVRRGPTYTEGRTFQAACIRTTQRSSDNDIAQTGQKRRILKNLKSGSKKQITEHLLKKQYLSKGSILREIGRKINEDDGGSSSISAITGTIHTARQGVHTVRAVRNSKRLVQSSFHKIQVLRKWKNEKQVFSKKAFLKKTPGKVAAVARGAVNTETMKGVKNRLVSRLESHDITDSGVGSVNLAIRTAETISDGIHTTSRGIQHGRSGHQYLKQRRIKKKVAKVAAKTLNQMAGGGAARSAAGVALHAAKAVIGSTASTAALAIGGALILLVMIVTSVTSGAGTVPSDVIMADEEVMESYVSEISRLGAEFQADIDAYQNNPLYEDVSIEYMGEIGAVSTNWQEIIAILAVEQEQDLEYTAKEQNRLGEIFHMMNKLSTRVQTYSCSNTGCTKTHKRLLVRVYCYSLENVIDDLGFSEDQKEWVRRLASSDLSEIYPDLAAMGGGGAMSGGLSAEEIKALLAAAPTTDVKRKKICETALSLVGKVPYFWGGKSAAGWNDRWNTPVLVTAAGNETTGTKQPYGLDCSGFTDWVYKTAGVGNMLSAGGSAYQWNQSYAISDKDLKPGDLVFMQPPNAGGVNHVGLFIGRDSKGGKLYCHCEWGSGVTVNGFKGFKYFRRPYVKFTD